jgi:lipoate---protein ligase
VNAIDPRWRVVDRLGDATELHAPWPAVDVMAQRIMARCRVVGSPTLVLGSTQPAVLGPRGTVIRRRSGGGAVLVVPGGQVWIDVWLPAGDQLWDDDVVRAAIWVGDTWARALIDLGASPDAVSVHPHGLRTEPVTAAVCFGGLGPGEVVVGGRKVVGIAQRRSRWGAWFQTMAPLRWEPAIIVAALQEVGVYAVPHDSRAALSRLDALATGLHAVVAPDLEDVDLVAACERAVMEALPGGAVSVDW